MGFSGLRFSVSDVEARCIERARGKTGEVTIVMAVSSPCSGCRTTRAWERVFCVRVSRALPPHADERPDPSEPSPSQPWEGAHLTNERGRRSPDRRKSRRSEPRTSPHGCGESIPAGWNPSALARGPPSVWVWDHSRPGKVRTQGTRVLRPYCGTCRGSRVSE